jgi:hypothetical protein
MSTDKSIIMRTFNTHLLDMLNDVLNTYPDNIEILTFKKTIETIKQLNPSIIIKSWYFFVYNRYKKQIDQGNLDFFFEKDYSSDLNYIDDSNDIIKMINNVRTPLSQMGDVNKEHTVSYLKNLNKLSYIYNEP